GIRDKLVTGVQTCALPISVRQLGWTAPYHVDADHINLDTVDRFIDASDFYTLDVASAIGKPPAEADVDAFVAVHLELSKDLGARSEERRVGKEGRGRWRGR